VSEKIPSWTSVCQERSTTVSSGNFTAPAKRPRAEHRPATCRTAISTDSFVLSDGRAVLLKSSRIPRAAVDAREGRRHAAHTHQRSAPSRPGAEPAERPEGRRRWRALDLGTTFAHVEAEAPRVACRQHGVIVAAVPWARQDSSFTRSFEDQVAWLAVNTSKTAVSQLMRIARQNYPVDPDEATSVLDAWLEWAAMSPAAVRPPRAHDPRSARPRRGCDPQRTQQRSRRAGQHADPADHPPRLRVSLTMDRHRPRDARPRRPMPAPTRPVKLTHGTCSRFQKHVRHRGEPIAATEEKPLAVDTGGILPCQVLRPLGTSPSVTVLAPWRRYGRSRARRGTKLTLGTPAPRRRHGATGAAGLVQAVPTRTGSGIASDVCSSARGWDGLRANELSARQKGPSDEGPF